MVCNPAYWWHRTGNRLVPSPQAIFGFILAIAFDPASYSGATDPRWAVLAIGLPILLKLSSPNHCLLPHRIGLAFIAWATLSLTLTANIWDGLRTLMELIIIATAFAYGGSKESLAPTFRGLAIGVTVSSAVILISPVYQIHSIVEVNQNGLFGNRNMLCEIAVLTALGLIVYKQYFYLIGLLPALFWPPISRGAILAAVAGLCAWLWPRSRTAACVLIGMVLLAGAASYGLDYRIASVSERLDIWRGVYSQITLFGHGLGSLQTLSPYFGGSWDSALERLDHAHNDALEILFELGLPGFVLYIALTGIALGCAFKAGPLGNPLPVLVAFLVISSVAFPWHIPANAFVGALVMGHAVRSWDLLWFSNNYRGPSLRERTAFYRRYAADKYREFADGGAV